MNHRDFKGIWIPKNIWLNAELSALEKVLLAEIESLDDGEGCIATNQYFAGFLGVSKSWVSKLISGLEKKKFITLELVYKRGKKEIDKRIIRRIPIELEDNTLYDNSDIPIAPECSDITEEEDNINIYNNNLINNKVNKENKLNNINIYNNGLQKIVNFYEQNINLLSPTIYEEIKSYLDDGLEAELIIKSLKEAVDRNCKNWRYAKGILDNCIANKIKTLHDFEIEQENFKNRKKGKPRIIENTKNYKEVDINEEEYAERLRKEKMRQQKEGA